MASNRDLKKAIGEIAEELYMESLFYYLHTTKDNTEKVEEIIGKINTMQEEFLKRLHNVPGKEDYKLVKTYYSKLKDDLNKSIKEITGELDKLHDKEFANAESQS